MSKQPEITTHTVLRARQDLSDRLGEPPSADEIAEYLRADKDTVLGLLRELQRKRIVKERRRRTVRVWTRWGSES